MAPSDGFADWSPPTDDMSGRHNVPFVRLTSNEYVSSSEQETPMTSTRPGSLYTITELTERSEVSRTVDHLSVQQRGTDSTPGSSTTTDYGQVLGKHFSMFKDCLSFLVVLSASNYPKGTAANQSAS